MASNMDIYLTPAKRECFIQCLNFSYIKSSTKNIRIKARKTLDCHHLHTGWAGLCEIQCPCWKCLCSLTSPKSFKCKSLKTSGPTVKGFLKQNIQGQFFFFFNCIVIHECRQLQDQFWASSEALLPSLPKTDFFHQIIQILKGSTIFLKLCLFQNS